MKPDEIKTDAERVFAADGTLLGFVGPCPLPDMPNGYRAWLVKVYEGVDDIRLCHKDLGPRTSKNAAIQAIRRPTWKGRWVADGVVGSSAAFREKQAAKALEDMEELAKIDQELGGLNEEVGL